MYPIALPRTTNAELYFCSNNYITLIYNLFTQHRYEIFSIALCPLRAILLQLDRTIGLKVSAIRPEHLTMVLDVLDSKTVAVEYDALTLVYHLQTAACRRAGCAAVCSHRTECRAYTPIMQTPSTFCDPFDMLIRRSFDRQSFWMSGPVRSLSARHAAGGRATTAANLAVIVRTTSTPSLRYAHADDAFGLQTRPSEEGLVA